MAQMWRLRRGTMDDLDGLYALATTPLVYRYLSTENPLAASISRSGWDSAFPTHQLGAPAYGSCKMDSTATPDVSSCGLMKLRERRRSLGCYTPIFGDMGWRYAWHGA
jgi:hypothetical protein